MLVPQLATFTLLASTVLAGKGCRRCDCHVSLRSWINQYDADEAAGSARQWVQRLVANGDFEQFQMSAAPSAKCTSQKCDYWQAWFKAWRLCANGSSYSCSSGAWGTLRYTIDCSNCESGFLNGGRKNSRWRFHALGL
ncbi:uncharacterized protein MYCFIDRAFT_207834 [Pseudocercospora fijiensis CIRAD86]|uniref:Secreted protein n=1 Tax=Pseudocercospora fijiensis (strain CIRAD86) TaxID=383855 RepID=M3B2C5_PSEFD|nr:uncharacterized protein MYCFIDRAFT_207834 [Pseudocercospora fijiensis CIRAD86]EME83562.1 hypothetical protein MYCFIDRAFT_207834 [Pseudocercospora fijiensis CIRAD86]